MGIEAIIVLIVIVLAIVLFVSEIIPLDLTALLLIAILVITGIISPQEGIDGFSNPATITVMFMFVLSAAIIKTGVLQYVGPLLAPIFRNHFNLGIIFMMISVAALSAFINNTPIVAVFIPVLVQAAYSAGRSPSKVLIPLSYASIMGGTCTLIGTSTNILVSGMAEKSGLPPIGMFDIAPMGLVVLAVGMLYMITIGIRLIPDRGKQENLNEKFGLHNYVTEIELLGGDDSIGKNIMNSSLVSELKMDILELRRGESNFYLPPGDMVLQIRDVLKARCDMDKISRLKEVVRQQTTPTMRIGDADMHAKQLVLIELVVTPNSEFDGQTLRELDFRRHYRAIPLAIRHRNECSYQNLHDLKLRSGDVILAEVKKHFVAKLKQMQTEPDAPFIVVSETGLVDFNKKRFAAAILVTIGVIIAATIGITSITIATIAGVVVLGLIRSMSPKEMYAAINWNIIFLLAGALSLGKAMEVSKLSDVIAHTLINHVGGFGLIAMVSGLYLITSLLTEIMSNNATAALITPIAISVAAKMEVSAMPFIAAVLFAASASFMTPVGYQTNTMIYAAGGYKFSDFLRVGTALNIILWITATIFIPIFFPF